MEVQKDKKVVKDNKYLKQLDEIKSSGLARLMDDKFNIIKQIKVEHLYNELRNMDKDVNTIVFDGIISQRLVDLSKEKNVEYLVAVKMSEVVKKPETVKIITRITK